MKGALLAAMAALLLAPSAAAHAGEHGVSDQLIENGRALVVGRFTAAQPGPLLVVPFVTGPAACGAVPDGGATVPLGNDSAITFWTNATGLHALVDVPPTPTGYAGVALDTHDGARALLLMQEQAIAIHALIGVAWQPDALDTTRTGVLGAPYPIPGTEMHAHDFTFEPEGGGLLLDHDASFRGGRACSGGAVGHHVFSFDAVALPESATPGRVVHVVALYDPTVRALLPRPLDASTRLLQANLYLARPGDDAADVRAALDTSFSAADGAPFGVILLALAWTFRK